MFDYSKYAKGNVYEILDNNGTPLNKLYMIVSNDQFNEMGNNVFMVMIDDPSSSIKHDIYHVPFNYIINKTSIPKHIYCEVLISVNKKRISRFKFTLSKNIQSQVDKKIIQMITGDVMYSLNDAIIEMHNIEMDKRIEYMVGKSSDIVQQTTECAKDNIKHCHEIDENSLDTEDSQKLFALKMKSESDEFNYDKPIDIVTSDDNDDTNLSNKPNKKETQKSKKETEKVLEPKDSNLKAVPIGQIDPKYQHVYDNKEDFLLDYYSLPVIDVAKKWKLQDIKSVSNRAIACRRMLKKQGYDMSYFEALSKEHKSNLMKQINQRSRKQHM